MGAHGGPELSLGDIVLNIAAAALGLGARCPRCQQPWRAHTPEGCPREKEEDIP